MGDGCVIIIDNLEGPGQNIIFDAALGCLNKPHYEAEFKKFHNIFRP